MHQRLWLLAGLTSLALLPLQEPTQASEDVAAVLRRQTQEMVDAVSAGSAAVWERYLDEKATYTAEDGTVLTKAEMVGQIKPLPEGVSGTLEVTDFKVTLHGPAAVTNYVSDEHETYHGHKLHCQYRSTDTWLQTPAGWRLIAAQVLALRTDPPASQLTPRQMAEYVGRYALAPTITYEIRRKDGGLEGQQTGRQAEPLRAEAPDVLFVPGKPRYRKVFLRSPQGRVTGFAERREAWDLNWARLP
jgi:Domain of unknown function (DUF4440)